jgi:hypothetical protein
LFKKYEIMENLFFFSFACKIYSISYNEKICCSRRIVFLLLLVFTCSVIVRSILDFVSFGNSTVFPAIIDVKAENLHKNISNWKSIFPIKYKTFKIQEIMFEISWPKNVSKCYHGNLINISKSRRKKFAGKKVVMKYEFDCRGWNHQLKGMHCKAE